MEKSKNQLKIKIISIGGAGTNMINRIMETTYNKNIDYITISTNRQDLSFSMAESKLLIGQKIANGLGAFGNMETGIKAVEESKEEIEQFLKEQLKDTHIVILVAALGGGNGTGVTPLISNMIRKMGIVTIGVVTTPFYFEGVQRLETTKKGKELLSKNVDTLIIIPKDNLDMNRVKTMVQAFKDSEDVVRQNVQEICNTLLSSKIEDLSHENLMKFLQEEII